MQTLRAEKSAFVASGIKASRAIQEYNSPINAVPQESPWLSFKILSLRSGNTILPRWRTHTLLALSTL
ncbi:hypothetical protein CEP66_24520 [Citrobacter koseri]|nr:hypothetical protein AM352_07695 [Citrobacter koseri]AVE70249.1 hypothetical protein AM351_21800 [Citrobacter koseri]AVK73947.1 hypothetical protein CEP66_24520 [Citrobacter koseri]PNN12957.1 hypothetical protein AL526_009685 [Citrobacter koseri]PNO80078.1 hypothetical protein MC77_014570 [Citrobacter koseri]